jgi:hypothetical protein
MPLAFNALLAKAAPGLVLPIPTISALTTSLLTEPVDMLTPVFGFLSSHD